MNNYYEQLNRECKKIAVEAIKDNSILSDNMLKKEESEFLLSDWNAFLIALICKSRNGLEITISSFKEIRTFQFVQDCKGREC